MPDTWKNLQAYCRTSKIFNVADRKIGRKAERFSLCQQTLRACLISQRVRIGEGIFSPARQKSAGILTDGKNF